MVQKIFGVVAPYNVSIIKDARLSALGTLFGKIMESELVFEA
jgi:hypothetical protein